MRICKWFNFVVAPWMEQVRCVQVAVCTPGRMIDLIKMKACNMLRVTYLVFDEADRMFDMGFEPQVSATAAQASHKAFTHIPQTNINW